MPEGLKKLFSRMPENDDSPGDRIFNKTVETANSAKTEEERKEIYNDSAKKNLAITGLSIASLYGTPILQNLVPNASIPSMGYAISGNALEIVPTTVSIAKPLSAITNAGLMYSLGLMLDNGDGRITEDHELNGQKASETEEGKNYDAYREAHSKELYDKAYPKQSMEPAYTRLPNGGNNQKGVDLFNRFSPQMRGRAKTFAQNANKDGNTLSFMEKCEYCNKARTSMGYPPLKRSGGKFKSIF